MVGAGPSIVIGQLETFGSAGANAPTCHSHHLIRS
jgi:hypothetical protein